MGVFSVKVGDAEYEVTAPDENSAWKMANQAHFGQKKPAYDIPAGLKSMMNIGQAVTFGFGDEIAGVLGADKDRYRATVEQFREEYPKSSMLGTVSGAALLPFGAGKMAAQSPWLAAGTVGAGVGALQGAGDAPTFESMPGDASKGFLFGGLGGPLLLGTMRGGGNVLSALGSKLPLIGDDIAQSLARRRVAQAFERDSTNADQVGSTMARLGGEARIADAAGENTRTLLNLNANMPGKTQNDLEAVIRNRIATRPDRMDKVVYAVNDGMGRAGTLTASLTEQQKKVAAPLYKALDSMEFQPSPQLVNDLTAAQKLGAWKEAEEISLGFNRPFSLNSVQQNLGQGKVGASDVDKIKQGLDSLIDRETDAITGKMTTKGAALVALKHRIVGEADAATGGAYEAARNAFAGPAALKSAIDKGRRFWAEDAESLANLVQGMSMSEREAFRVGAAEQLRNMVGNNPGQNKLIDVWKNRNTREKLQALLGNDVKYAQVEKLLKSEETLKRLESLGAPRGSRTQTLMTAEADQSENLARDIVDMGTGGKAGLMRPLLGAMGNLAKGNMTPTEPVRDAIGSILLKQYAPAELIALREAQEAMRRAAAAAASGSGVAGGKIGPGLLD